MMVTSSASPVDQLLRDVSESKGAAELLNILQTTDQKTKNLA